MYLKDKDYQLNVRLNEQQRLFIQRLSSLYGVTPSKFVRMVIERMICEVGEHENKKADIDR